MKKISIISFLVLLAWPLPGWCVSAAQGQYLFDQVFWLIMTIFVMGLSFGLAIKMINRS
jgi:hypothetical protein